MLSMYTEHSRFKEINFAINKDYKSNAVMILAQTLHYRVWLFVCN